MLKIQELFPHALRFRSELARKIDHVLERLSMSRRFHGSKGQDRWIAEEVFPNILNGFFVEVGAGDGRTHSNTFILERDRGWTGILIEADPSMADTMRRYRTCTCVNACVDSQAHCVKFLHFGHVGGIVADDTDNCPKFRSRLLQQRSNQVGKMKTRLLGEILDVSSAPSLIDFLSIDIEGAELRVLSTFPFGRYSFKAITIERPTATIHQILSSNGYKLVRIQQYDGFYLSNQLASDLAIMEPSFGGLSKKHF